MNDEAKPRYLVRMTTPRCVAYLCSSVTDGIVGWVAQQTIQAVSRYQMPHAAKRAAQLQWNRLSQLFEITSIDVITTDGQIVWTAQDGGQAQPWRGTQQPEVQP